MISGEAKNINFVFYLASDTALAVAAEMVELLDLADHDVAFIADFIGYLIRQTVTNSKSSSAVGNKRDTGMEGEPNDVITGNGVKNWCPKCMTCHFHQIFISFVYIKLSIHTHVRMSECRESDMGT